MNTKTLISFIVEGIVNSFRKPGFETFQISYTLPPKTVVCGLLTNIMGKGEKFLYEFLEKFEYSTFLVSLGGKFVDLWHGIQGKGEGKEKTIFYREELFKPVYKIFVRIDADNQEIKKFLEKPKRVPYFGLGDEIVKISNVKVIPDKKIYTNEVWDILPVEYMDKIEDIVLRESFGNSVLNIAPSENDFVVKFQVSWGSYGRKERTRKEVKRVFIAPGRKFILKEKVEVNVDADGVAKFILF